MMIPPETSASLPRILVISDNAELSGYLLDLIAKDSLLSGLDCELRYSAKNASPQAMRALGAKSVNLKDSATVATIISTKDLVLSLHCKQIFPHELVRYVTCINIHPGLNPYNRGWFPQVFSIINGLPAGATIHLMDEDVDHGPIIYQKTVPVLESDTSLSVYRKVIAAEKNLLNTHFANLVLGEYQSVSTMQEGNYNNIADFKALCAIDLNHVGTMAEHLNLLRALTHGTLENAYFISNDGKKHFVRITIDTERNFS
ncbi:dTDP-4-amino-4,6-dideoxyglucose formyltransferase [Kosakonia sp. 1610]|uniref:dTDP-4-amino-4,6-dideoxyglucose formyltransferase n=1 Tax=Kosakonia sp. 1610 TaxID=3156426 RepID=UPI003D1B5255